MYQQPTDFDLPLDSGFTVAIGPGSQPRLITQHVVNTEICVAQGRPVQDTVISMLRYSFVLLALDGSAEGSAGANLTGSSRSWSRIAHAVL